MKSSGAPHSLRNVPYLLLQQRWLLFRFTGAPDVTYRLQRAASVTGTWSDLATNTAPAFRLRGAPKRRFGATAAGLIEYHGTPPLPGQAFYRTVQP